ncbi:MULTISPECIES: winged helix-turn-helix domain-containing protein [unclassified Pseudomonas]|uniref:ATP-binding protein n=1 Tax=unclassified Pseudomonas TaxID=196821 RepID=UPI000BDD5208|nr:MULTISPECIES: winged helix-turn-helix domain-containing protein [unclassified Pseudomonas]PVZ12543.1 putative ATPase [Pseudomonas sp. URIL14HWK12:I12]PVZ23305.1 putative ATPase [Pseudomonas sp. URIL14HWK12:I10]PVZ32635.1 putative ATPase [Pseudomonas sp. URIL14HWK12:I11]SNZ13789.1 Predicted ATPase [Pseudomonas sp. URIL14HWK12:I9]
MTPTSVGLQNEVAAHGPMDGEAALRFGPFLLYPRQQVLLRDNQPVALGSRALSLLAALAARPGELVEKNELLALVWPRAVVEECNLRAQVVALRRALGESDEFSYIVTVPGRGYRFVAPVHSASPAAAMATLPAGGAALPNVATRVIGREATLQALRDQLQRRRFVTLIGPGGGGKTTAALAVANQLAPAFEGGVAFVDLAVAVSRQQVQGMLANALGVSALGDDPLRLLGPAEGRFLLVLDNCEHVLDDLAEAIETLLQQGPQYRVLVASREPLHAQGEYLHALGPLAVPPAGERLTPSQALAWPAVELFIKRVATHDPDFVLQAADTEAVCSICRKLDGNALALEIAAARVRTFGVRELVGLLDSSFRLQMTGRRTGLARHRTLSATLDWTYGMLSAPEQALLRQLSVLCPGFTLEAAGAVADSVGHDLAPLLESLVGKSLLGAFEHSHGKRYSLLETTRLYAHYKLEEAGETQRIGLRHAQYRLGRLREAVACLDRLSPAKWLAQYGPEIDNVRNALQWAFAEHGDGLLGIELTLHSAPLWLRLSLLGECEAWIERGLLAASKQANARPQAMVLQTFRASILTLTHGGGTAVREAWQAVLDDATALGDSQHQLRALWGLWNDRVCCNDPAAALALADQYSALSQREQVLDRQLLARRMQAVPRFYLGDVAGARQAIGEALSSPFAPRSHIIDLHFDQRLAARALKALIQLIEGNGEQAQASVEQLVGDAVSLNHPATLWYCLCYSALPVSLMRGDIGAARYYLRQLQSSIASQELPLWWRHTQCFECVVSLREQHSEATLTRLGELLAALREQHSTPLYSLFACEYAQALGAQGLPQWGLDALEQTLDQVQARDENWYLAELLRAKAALVLQAEGNVAAVHAHALLAQAKAVAQRQGARFWEQRVWSLATRSDVLPVLAIAAH